MALYTVFLVSPTILATVGSRKSSGQNDEARFGEWTSNQAATSGNITLETVSRARQAVEAAERAARPRNSPQIPPGSVGGHGAGQRIPQSLREQYFLEGCPTPPCSYCRQNPATELDHVVPCTRSGDLTPDNITPSCRHCNASKGARETPKTPPSIYLGNWPADWWPQWMKDAWHRRYGN